MHTHFKLGAVKYFPECLLNLWLLRTNANFFLLIKVTCPRDADMSTAEDAMLAIHIKVAAQRVKIKLRYRGEKHKSRHRGSAHTAAGLITTRPRLSIIINVEINDHFGHREEKKKQNISHDISLIVFGFVVQPTCHLLVQSGRGF